MHCTYVAFLIIISCLMALFIQLQVQLEASILWGEYRQQYKLLLKGFDLAQLLKEVSVTPYISQLACIDVLASSRLRCSTQRNNAIVSSCTTMYSFFIYAWNGQM